MRLEDYDGPACGGSMIRVGLTGGIGSGKSSVARRFGELGAVVIDADAIAREVVAPGEPALEEIAHRFGTVVLQPSGELDRGALAALVFTDAEELQALNAITHPRIAKRSAELIEQAPRDAVVVYDMPLLIENGLAGQWDWVVVVLAPAKLRMQRLLARGVGADHISERMAAQVSDEQRKAVADIIIDNSSGLAELQRQTDDAWQRMTGARDDRAGRQQS